MQKKYDDLGIFVLPSETEYEWGVRADPLISKKSEPPLILKELYQIHPEWVPVVYEKKELYPWEIALTLFDGRCPWIEVTPHLKDKKKYLGIYSKEEILTHEYIHAVRAPFESEKYEEFFAYYPGIFFKNAFRAFLGPVFSSAREVQLLLLMVSFLFISQLFFESCFLWAFSLVVGYFFFLFSRLTFRWVRWFFCKKRVGLPFMVRLLDSEIDKIATLGDKEFILWIEEEKKKSFRMHFLIEKYLQKH